MPELLMENNNKLVMTSLEPSPELGVIGILRKASTIPSRNGRLTVSLILLMLLPFLLLSLGYYLALDAIGTELLSQISHLPEDLSSLEAQKILKEISEYTLKLLEVELIFALAFSLFSLFSLTITVSSSAMLYVGKHFTLKDLFQRVKITWKGTLITVGILITVQFIAFFSTSCFLALLGVAAIFARVGVLFIVLAVMIRLEIIFYIWLANIWMLGLVISVIEDGCNGMQAVAKARRFINGIKLQAILFMMLILLVEGIGAVVLHFTGRATKYRGVVWLFVNIGMSCFICLVKLFSYVVYTVFYHACKQSHDEYGDCRDKRSCDAPHK